MGLQTNLIRRNATYAWRKRLPVEVGGGLMQISLRTNDPNIAKRVAAVVSSECWHIFRLMRTTQLSKPDARILLTFVIERELERISHGQTMRMDDPSPMSWQTDQSHDWAMGKALQLLAERGVSGEELTARDRAALLAEGRTTVDIERLEAALATEAQSFQHPPAEGPNARVKQVMEAALGRSGFSHMEYLQGRQIYMNGRGAGLLSAHKGDASTAEACELAERLLRSDQGPVDDIKDAPQEQVQPAPVENAKTKPAKPVENGYDPKFTSLIQRLMEQKQRQKMSAQSISQMEKTLMMFVECTELNSINDLQQVHVARYIDMLHELPKVYRRSPKTRKMTLKQILTKAKADGTNAGLSVATINRNIDYLGQLLKKARSEGFTTPNHIDLNSLRLRKKSRERDECPPFAPKDVEAIFQHPVWHGAKSLREWQVPGEDIRKDGHYWIPAIAALTGARRAEIAGLRLDDIAVLEGIPVFRLRENENRSIKTFGSARDVPIHPQIIELGLMEHVEHLRSKGEVDLFPDMRPKAGTKEKWGGKIDYRFRLLLERQLTAGRNGKSFKSFRHYVITQLGRSPQVAEYVRKDIVGHVGDSITSERYSDTATLQEKLEAISTLPNLLI